MPEQSHEAALNLRHLKAWIAVVDEGSVTAAARSLGVSQPALSQQLRALEDFFGSKLLERFYRGVKPTPLGRTLLSDARITLAAAARLTRQAKAAAGLEVGVLEIATLPTLVEAVMIEPIQQLQTRHPNITVRIKEFALQSSMIDAVATGFGDLAIGVRPPRWQGPIVSLGWEQFVVVLPPDDPLAQSTDPLALDQLAEHNWVLYEPSNGLADYVAAACALAGFRPREAVLTSQVQVAINLASAGLGAVLVPASNVPHGSGHRARPLDPPISWELAAFSRSELSAEASAFVDLLRTYDWLERPAGAVVLPGA